MQATRYQAEGVSADIPAAAPSSRLKTTESVIAFPVRSQLHAAVLGANSAGNGGRADRSLARWASPSFGGDGRQRVLGILTAILLHAVLLSVLFKNKPEPQRFIPPVSPVMVELISEARPQGEAPPVQKPVEPIKPSIKPKAFTPKPKTTPKPKRVHPQVKRPPILSAPSEAPAQPPAAEREPPAPQPPAETAPLPPRAAAPTPGPAPISPPRFNADYLHNPAPAYPALSRSRGEEGRVVLRVLVDAEGRAEQVDIRTSSGHDRLDDSARATVKQWKFVPARQGDQPVPARVLVPISFSLEE